MQRSLANCLVLTNIEPSKLADRRQLERVSIEPRQSIARELELQR
jgi:hypothetical protein